MERVEAARNLPAGRLEARIEGDLDFGTNFLYPNSNTLGESGRIDLNYAMAEYLGLHIGTSFSHSQITGTTANASTNFPLSGSSLDSWIFSARLAWPHKVGPMRFALEPSIAAPPSTWCTPYESSTGAHSGSLCASTSPFASPALTGLISVDTKYIRIHLNVGYLWDNSLDGAVTKNSSGAVVAARVSEFDSFALGISGYDDLFVRLAIEAAIGVFNPYVEWNLDIPVNREHFAGCSTSGGKTCGPAPTEFPAAFWQTPDRLGVGARFLINSRMAVDVGFEGSLTQAGANLTLPAKNAETPSKTASPVAVPDVVLPPPFLLRIGFNWQFDLHLLPTSAEDPLHQSEEPPPSTSTPQPDASSAPSRADQIQP